MVERFCINQKWIRYTKARRKKSGLDNPSRRIGFGMGSKLPRNGNLGTVDERRKDHFDQCKRTQDTLTDYHCNCKQPMAYNNNHERTPFVEYIIPMFKYLAKETNLLGFAWCEKLVETQKYAQIADVDYNLTEVKKKYADGLGKLNRHESVFLSHPVA